MTILSCIDGEHIVGDFRGLLEERAELGKGRVADGSIPAPLSLEEVPPVLDFVPIRAIRPRPGQGRRRSHLLWASFHGPSVLVGVSVWSDLSTRLAVLLRPRHGKGGNTKV